MIANDIIKVKDNNYISHILKICDIFKNWSGTMITGAQKQDNYQLYLEAYAAFEAKLLAIGVEFEAAKFIEENFKHNIGVIIDFVTQIENNYKTEQRKLYTSEIISTSRNKFQQDLDIGFYYKFSDGDLKRIQELINELRDEISSNKIFKDDHKERLLMKLDGLQKELHKNVSSLDKF